VKDYLEPRLEAEFDENSYGYRPKKSAHQAIESVQKNIRTYGWVIDMDIKSFFDEVDHELLMKALERHVSEKWVKLYILRWLQSSKQQSDGELIANTGKGTPQGGVISPLLANLFLHYVFDKWFRINYPELKFVRYADDMVVHCKTEQEAQLVLSSIRNRLQECKLALNEEKTKIVQCKDYRQADNSDYSKKFDFLGFTFKPMSLSSKRGRMFLGYGSEVSQKSQTRIINTWKQERWQRRSELSIQDIATRVNPQSVGILRYYGKFKTHHLQRLFRHLENRIVKWVLNKYKGLKQSFSRGYQWLEDLKKSYPTMFYYWTIFRVV
jgi:group II intron reverse transcriptase/maturase